MADDAADALAIALCHLVRRESRSPRRRHRAAIAPGCRGQRGHDRDLSGRFQLREPAALVVETAGVGYEVFVPLSTYYRLPAAGRPVNSKFARWCARTHAFYGFTTAAEKRAFDLLMGVQHVGPKLALAILSVLSPEELVAAITREDVDRIDAVPGVGPKVAERIVRELRDKAAELKLIAPDSGQRRRLRRRMA